MALNQDKDFKKFSSGSTNEYGTEHMIELIPSLFSEISKGPPEEATMKAIQEAIPIDTAMQDIVSMMTEDISPTGIEPGVEQDIIEAIEEFEPDALKKAHYMMDMFEQGGTGTMTPWGPMLDPDVFQAVLQESPDLNLLDRNDPDGHFDAADIFLASEAGKMVDEAMGNIGRQAETGFNVGMEHDVIRGLGGQLEAATNPENIGTEYNDDTPISLVDKVLRSVGLLDTAYGYSGDTEVPTDVSMDPAAVEHRMLYGGSGPENEYTPRSQTSHDLITALEKSTGVRTPIPEVDDPDIESLNELFLSETPNTMMLLADIETFNLPWETLQSWRHQGPGFGDLGFWESMVPGRMEHQLFKEGPEGQKQWERLAESAGYNWKDLWTEIENRFGPTDEPQRFILGDDDQQVMALVRNYMNDKGWPISEEGIRRLVTDTANPESIKITEMLRSMATNAAPEHDIYVSESGDPIATSGRSGEDLVYEYLAQGLVQLQQPGEAIGTGEDMQVAWSAEKGYYNTVTGKSMSDAEVAAFENREIEKVADDVKAVTAPVTRRVDPETGVTQYEFPKTTTDTAAASVTPSQKQTYVPPTPPQDTQKPVVSTTQPPGEPGASGAFTKDDLAAAINEAGGQVSQTGQEVSKPTFKDDFLRVYYKSMYLEPESGRAENQRHLENLYEEIVPLFFLLRGKDWFDHSKSDINNILSSSGDDYALESEDTRRDLNQWFDRFIADYKYAPEEYRAGSLFQQGAKNLVNIWNRLEDPSDPIENWSADDKTHGLLAQAFFGTDDAGLANRRRLRHMHLSNGGNGYWAQQLHNASDQIASDLYKRGHSYNDIMRYFFNQPQQDIEMNPPETTNNPGEMYPGTAGWTGDQPPYE